MKSLMRAGKPAPSQNGPGSPGKLAARDTVLNMASCQATPPSTPPLLAMRTKVSATLKPVSAAPLRSNSERCGSTETLFVAAMDSVALGQLTLAVNEPLFG